MLPSGQAKRPKASASPCYRDPAGSSAPDTASVMAVNACSPAEGSGAARGIGLRAPPIATRLRC